MADNDQQKLIALYGPQRTLEREKQAKKFRQSNVHVLQKGMAYDFDAPAESTTRESFKVIYLTAHSRLPIESM